jgi:hypothetical protein
MCNSELTMLICNLILVLIEVPYKLLQLRQDKYIFHLTNSTRLLAEIFGRLAHFPDCSSISFRCRFNS